MTEPPTRRKRPTVPRPSEATVVSIFGGPGAINDPDNIRPTSEPIRGTPGKVYEGIKGRTRKTPPKKKTFLSQRWTQVAKAIKNGDYTMKEFVKTLDPEELVRGQLKDKRGDFSGRPPSMVPSEFHHECMREMLRRGDEIWRGAYLEAIQAFTAIATDTTMEPRDRMKAAQYVVERVAGKVPERIEIATSDPWQDIISGIVAEAEDSQIQRASRVLNGDAE